MTRLEFEDACAGLLSRVTGPIERALAAAGLKPADIHAVELLGGGVRVPKVKKMIEDFFKESKVDVGQVS